MPIPYNLNGIPLHKHRFYRLGTNQYPPLKKDVLESE